MKKFRLAPDFDSHVFDAYKRYVYENSNGLDQFIDMEEPLSFEEIVTRVQRDGCDGYKPGQHETALSLVLMVQAGLVEVV